MFGIGGSELAIIVVLAIFLFGPDKLPEIARTVGRFVRDFKRYQAMMESVIKAEMYDLGPKPSVDPLAAAREYRRKAGVTAPGESIEEYDPELIDPDLAGTGWRPGVDGGPAEDASESSPSSTEPGEQDPDAHRSAAADAAAGDAGEEEGERP